MIGKRSTKLVGVLTSPPVLHTSCRFGDSLLGTRRERSRKQRTLRRQSETPASFLPGWIRELYDQFLWPRWLILRWQGPASRPGFIAPATGRHCNVVSPTTRGQPARQQNAHALKLKGQRPSGPRRAIRQLGLLATALVNPPLMSQNRQPLGNRVFTPRGIYTAHRRVQRIEEKQNGVPRLQDRFRPMNYQALLCNSSRIVADPTPIHRHLERSACQPKTIAMTRRWSHWLDCRLLARTDG